MVWLNQLYQLRAVKNVVKVEYRLLYTNLFVCFDSKFKICLWTNGLLLIVAYTVTDQQYCCVKKREPYSISESFEKQILLLSS